MYFYHGASSHFCFYTNLDTWRPIKKAGLVKSLNLFILKQGKRYGILCKSTELKRDRCSVFFLSVYVYVEQFIY